MTAIFQTIGDFLYAVVNLLLNLVQGLIHLLQMIPSALTMTMNSIAYMPGVLTAFAVGLITVSVCYLVIGR